VVAPVGTAVLISVAETTVNVAAVPFLPGLGWAGADCAALEIQSAERPSGASLGRSAASTQQRTGAKAMQNCSLTIDGKAAPSDRSFDLRNPADGTLR
jgi:hypothetical protein